VKIHIACHGDISGWILGKFANKLEEYLRSFGDEVTIGQDADPLAEVNHHIAHYYTLSPASGIQTQMITHIDSIMKFNALKQQLSIAEVGICMSQETVNNLVSGGIPRTKLCFINPAHDSVLVPRRRRVGIVTRVYDDGRKREHLLGKLADHIHPKDFEFVIMGTGWEPQIELMRQKQFTVQFFPDFDYEEYVHLLPLLDYFMYFGEDEGQMGFIDALAAGVETIVVPQGYHLDVDDAISYPFRTLDELIKVFLAIAEKNNRLPDKVADWTWENYAKKHREIWIYLLAKKRGTAYIPAISPGKDGVGSIITDYEKSTSFTHKIIYLIKLYKGLLNHKFHRYAIKVKAKKSIGTK
jgi:hypothetical protein